MHTITWLFLIAALLPVIAAGCAKAGAKGFDNEQPRTWLANLQGWRARANAAQSNTFEALPFFFAASLYSLHQNVEPGWLAGLMGAWIIARLAYLACYIGGYGTLRSLVWTLALALNIVILFA
ncbi:MAG TPA: hypothetical protein DEB15_11235 [Pusillimonas sp.]|jgi:uncharacterized MAPEG superfamily protein|nr:hypothetical protein [Pusillimonas sp.]|tara:strand:- start:10607 stop:10975 length:369 start_codon:yes stop_codon:yes gene_type:complete